MTTIPTAFRSVIERVRILVQDVGYPGDLFVTGNFTIPTQNDVYRLDVGGTSTITLPACTDVHPSIIIRKVNPAGTVTIQRAGSDTINGAATDILLERRFSTQVFAPSSASNWTAHEDASSSANENDADLVFSDEMIYEELQHESVAVHQMWLIEQLVFEDPPSLAVSNFYPYEAFVGSWSSDTVVYDEDSAVVTPDTADLIKGIWYFDSDNRPTKDLYVRGTVFDTYATAATLLVRWANTIKLDYNTSNDKGSFSRLDRIPKMMDLARDYRTKVWPYNVRPVSPHPRSSWSSTEIWNRGW